MSEKYTPLINGNTAYNTGALIQQLIDENLKKINTIMLMKIKEINENTLDLEQVLTLEGKPETSITINNVLIGFSYSQEWITQFKLKKGDIGLAIVIQNDITDYRINKKKTGGKYITGRFKDKNDAIFIPLSFIETRTLSEVNFLIENANKKCKLEFNNDEIGTLKARLLILESENTTLKKVLTSLAGLLEGMAGGQTGPDGHGHTSTTAPASVGKFTAWVEQELNKLLKE